MNKFTERMHFARKNCNLSQQEIANIIGVSRATVSSWETGRTEIDNNSLTILAQILNTSSDYLLGITDTPFILSEPTSEELYKKLIEQNPNNNIHFYDADGLNEEDFKIIQNTIDTLRMKNKLK